MESLPPPLPGLALLAYVAYGVHRAPAGAPATGAPGRPAASAQPGVPPG